MFILSTLLNVAQRRASIGKTARAGLGIGREGERKLNFPYIDAVITKETARKSSTIEGDLFYDLHFLVRLTLKDNI